MQPEQTAEEKSQELRASLANGAADDHYFDILESRSIRLQNQVAGILKAITFQAEPNIADLEAAIARFVATDVAAASGPIGLRITQFAFEGRGQVVPISPFAPVRNEEGM